MGRLRPSGRGPGPGRQPARRIAGRRCRPARARWRSPASAGGAGSRGRAGRAGRCRSPIGACRPRAGAGPVAPAAADPARLGRGRAAGLRLLHADRPSRSRPPPPSVRSRRCHAPELREAPAPSPAEVRQAVAVRSAHPVRAGARPHRGGRAAAGAVLPPRAARDRARSGAATATIVVQLGAFISEANAERAWVNAQRRFGLNSHAPLTANIDMDGRTLHRVAIAGFAGQGDAQRLCGSIRAQGGVCFVRDPGRRRLDPLGRPLRQSAPAQRLRASDRVRSPLEGGGPAKARRPFAFQPRRSRVSRSRQAMRTATPISTCSRIDRALRIVGDLAVDLDAAVHRAGMHDDGVRRGARRGGRG